MSPTPGEAPRQPPASAKQNARALVVRALVGVAVVAAVGLILWLTGYGSFLWELLSDRGRIQRVVDGAGVLAPVVYVAFLVGQAVLAPMPAPAVAIAGGYTFGVYEGFFLTWLGCLVGGVISFWISRLFGRGLLASSGRTERLDRYVAQHGTIVIFVLRLIPLVSFDAISYAAGLSSIPFGKFLLATALGMAPGTFAFVYLGGASSGPGVWAALIGLAVLASAAYVYQRRNLRLGRRVR